MNGFYTKFDLTQHEIKQIEKVKRKYPMKVSKYYLDLIKEKNDPIWKQCIPSIEELNDNVNEEDPLHEEKYSPVSYLVHRYPDRVLLLVSNRCAMYCRFCTRKRKVGRIVDITKEHILNAISYIKKHKEIRDVIVSGGDPLMLRDKEIEFVLKNLRQIKHVEIIRIGTRIPCTYPMRVTKKLCNMLKKYHPLYINLHFEHPDEITEESSRACRMLSNAGIPLGNQCVLLNGVNNDPKVLKDLFQKLLTIRVKPYYMYQADQVKGTDHFRTNVQDGLKIIEKLTGFTSGLCVPHYVIDSYGGGKIPILPEYMLYKNNEKVVLRNFEGKTVDYTNPLIENKQEFNDNLNIGVVFNLKKNMESGKPLDWYAEFDEIDVPLAIKKSLEKYNFKTELLEADINLFEKLKSGNYDFIFNIAEGFNCESREAQVPAMLDLLNIPYTGSGVFAQALTLNKTRTKEILLHYGIHTPKHQLFTSPNQKINPDLQFPMIIKPNAEGSSKGINNDSLVKDEEELKNRVKYILSTYKQPALAEEFLEGREFTVSILGNNPPRVLPIVEVTFDYLPENVNKFDSYEVKWYWDNPSNPINPIICPANISKQLESKLKTVALKTYKALGCVDLCRIDIRLDNRGIPNVLEVNALPGLMPDPKENSRFPKACFAAGMSYDDIILEILNSAMKRYGLTKKIKSVQSLEKNENKLQI
ncbi:KamA family radical SAM protein [Candidatus Woesearchaeota archaeon]|nr:KamA family radical SAM protein [Candidatus Woesearchaeota archaeon]